MTGGFLLAQGTLFARGAEKNRDVCAPAHFAQSRQLDRDLSEGRSLGRWIASWTGVPVFRRRPFGKGAKRGHWYTFPRCRERSGKERQKYSYQLRSPSGRNEPGCVHRRSSSTRWRQFYRSGIAGRVSRTFCESRFLV